MKSHFLLLNTVVTVLTRSCCDISVAQSKLALHGENGNTALTKKLAPESLNKSEIFNYNSSLMCFMAKFSFNGTCNSFLWFLFILRYELSHW